MKSKILLNLSLTLVFSMLLLTEKDLGASIRAKIITDSNITLAHTQKMQKLKLLTNAFTKSEFSALMDEIAKVVYVNKKRRTSFYFNDSYKDAKYKVIAYGVNKEQSKKIATIIDSFTLKHNKKLGKKYYRFIFSGEKRIYPYTDFLTPVIGYGHKLENNGLTYANGIKGIEKFYDATLSAHAHQPKDIYLNINFDLQLALEEEIFFKKVDIDADEVISIVIDPKTFDIKAFASSNRFNPKKIYREDYSSLNIFAVEKLFDIGHYLTPIKNAITKENSLTLEDGYKKFGFYEKSGIDLNYEKASKDTMQVNLVQLLKMYTVFYSGGKIAIPSILKRDTHVLFKQVISKEKALNTKKNLVDFFKQMPTDAVTLKDSNTSAYVHIREIEKDSQRYLQIFLTVNPKNEYYSDEVGFVETPDDFPYIIVLSSSQGSSNQVHTYHIYSKKTKNIKIGEVRQPINKWQANNRNGSEARVEGIYKNDNGDYFIDRLTTKGTKTASCNACQKHNVETFKVTNDGIVSVNLRKFDIETYKPFN